MLDITSFVDYEAAAEDYKLLSRPPKLTQVEWREVRRHSAVRRILRLRPRQRFPADMAGGRHPQRSGAFLEVLEIVAHTDSPHPIDLRLARRRGVGHKKQSLLLVDAGF
jgi:hypothetical protein